MAEKLSPKALALLAQLFGDDSQLQMKPNAAALVLEIQAWIKAQGT